MHEQAAANYKIHRKHYALHVATVAATLLVGFVLRIWIDCAVLSWHNKHHPLQVRWASATTNAPYGNPQPLPSNATLNMELGLRSDGAVVWRYPVK